MLRRLAGRIGTALLFVLVGLCWAPTLAPPWLDRIYYEGPPTGHFDGRHFFNPEDGYPRRAEGPPGRFMGRMLRGDGRAGWPDHLPVVQTVPPARVDGRRMLVTWIGHSTVLVQTSGFNILTDPIWSERASPFSFVGPKRVRAPGIAFEQLPKIDLVLVSHNHYDHMDLPTLKRLWDRDRPLIVTSLGNDTILRHAGIAATARDWGGQVPLKGGARVIVERVHHWGSRWGSDRNRALWSGFTIVLPGGNLFFAGDTGWAGGSWASEAARHGPFRFAEESVAAFRRLGAARALGVHWGTFRLTFEAIGDPPKRLAAALQAEGVPADRFVVTDVGKTFEVPQGAASGTSRFSAAGRIR